MAALIGATPCVDYDDAGAMADWLSRVFGFVERARYIDGQRRVRQVEMYVGETEFWFSGRGARKGQWVVVWVDDVEAQFRRVTAAGIVAEPPTGADLDMHQFHCKDPGGCGWTFARRTGRPYVQQTPTEQGGWEEVRP